MSAPPPAGSKPTTAQGPWGQPARSGPSSDPPITAPRSLYNPPVPGAPSVLARQPKATPPPPEPDPDPVQITDDIGICISPLYKDKSADETVKNIFSLLNSVGVRNFDVKAIRVNLKEGYAKIELPEKAIEEYLVKTLRETYKLKNQFNFSTITDDFEKFRVKRLNNYVDPIIQPPTQRAATFVTSKTSMPSLPPCQCHERFFYKYNERIGFESRTMEFKCGHWNMKLQENVDLVGKYVCAFLNGGGGIMYLGVHDDGTVKGIQCKEEQFLLFQKAISGVPNYIEPKITKDAFQINKIKVRDYPKGGQVCVLEVCIKPLRPAADHDTPYMYNGKSYWRREASTHQYQQW